MSKALHVLAIESSCDETAVAVLAQREGAPELLSSRISSQVLLHREHGGVVPELASRNHSLNLPELLQLALDESGLGIADMDAFAATAGPGLASSLLVGLSAAKGLALGARRPFHAVNHLEGHLLSPFIDRVEGFRPNLSLIVSGGHTLLIDCETVGEYQLVGKSRDDAAGEAFDKVGKMLGLPYPGGPEIERAAVGGDAKAFELPRSMMRRGELDFSFSGLKTAVLYLLPELYQRYRHETGREEDGLLDADLKNLCASFQAAVVEVLVKKCLWAARQSGRRLISVSGGVSCNQALRQALQQACEAEGVELLLPAPALTTDNAAMIAYAALQRHLRGLRSSLEDDIDPNLPLTEAGNRAKASRKL